MSHFILIFNRNPRSSWGGGGEEKTGPETSGRSKAVDSKAERILQLSKTFSHWQDECKERNKGFFFFF